MITLGVDAHKQSHVASVLDDAGRPLHHREIPNRPARWVELRAWADSLGSPRQWAIEGAWGYGRGLAQYLVASGEVVYEVNEPVDGERAQARPAGPGKRTG